MDLNPCERRRKKYHIRVVDIPMASGPIARDVIRENVFALLQITLIFFKDTNDFKLESVNVLAIILDILKNWRNEKLLFIFLKEKLILIKLVLITIFTIFFGCN